MRIAAVSTAPAGSSTSGLSSTFFDSAAARISHASKSFFHFSKSVIVVLLGPRSRALVRRIRAKLPVLP